MAPRYYDVTIPISPDLPVWPGDPKVRLERSRLADGGNVVDAIAFNQAGPAWRGVVQLAYRLDVNEFRNRRTAQLVVEHMQSD